MVTFISHSSHIIVNEKLRLVNLIYKYTDHQFWSGEDFKQLNEYEIRLLRLIATQNDMKFFKIGKRLANSRKFKGYTR